MIADAAAEACARAQSRHPAAQVGRDWHALVADPQVDAVIVATPTGLHFEMALAALRAGKHVLVEKPMAASVRDAEILVEEAERRRLVLMVDHTFVYTGAVQKIRDLIVTGVVGDVFYYDSTRVNLGLFQSDVNVLWDLAVHDLAILDFALGARPLAVSATGTGHFQGAAENMAHITLYLDGGVTAHLNVNWLAPVKIRRTLIGGNRRMIIYDDLEPSEKVKVYDCGVEFRASPGPRAASDAVINRLKPHYRMGDVWIPHLPIKEALLVEMEHFAQCIATGAAPLTSGACGLRVVSMLEGASQSLRRRGHPIDLSDLRQAS